MLEQFLGRALCFATEGYAPYVHEQQEVHTI